MSMGRGVEGRDDNGVGASSLLLLPFLISPSLSSPFVSRCAASHLSSPFFLCCILPLLLHIRRCPHSVLFEKKNKDILILPCLPSAETFFFFFFLKKYFPSTSTSTPHLHTQRKSFTHFVI